MNFKRMLKRYRHRTLTALICVSAVLICYFANLIVYDLAQFGQVSTDLTDNQYFSISEDTRTYLNNLPEVIEITVMGEKSEFDNYIRKVLKRFDSQSDRLSVQYIDPLLHPDIAAKYQKDGVTEKGTIVVSNNIRFETFNATECYVSDENENLIGFNAEGRLVAAIIKVINQKQKEIVFTEGHNEGGYTELVKLFENNNITVSRINLNNAEISGTTDLVVISGPDRDFDATEINKLDAFTKNGGKVMIFKESRTRSTDRLSQFLSQWGMQLQGNVIIDNEFYYMDNPLYLLTAPTAIPLLKKINDGDKLLIAPIAQEITKNFENDRNGMYSTETLLTSSSASYSKLKTSGMSYEFTEGDRKGPFNIAVLSTNASFLDSNSVPASVFLCGSAIFVDNTLLTIQNFANSDFVMTVANEMLGSKDNFIVPVKYFDSGYLNLSANTSKTLGIVFTFVFPGIVLAIGIFVWIKRRNM